MSITYYMLQIPPTFLFILMIGVFGLIAGVGTYIFRKKVQLNVLRSHNEVTGFLFLAVASFYALLLSFVVFVVWGQLNETHTNVSKEGSSALSLYRDIKFYPDAIESKLLMTVYLDYVYNVLDEEFPNMDKMQTSIKTPEAFNKVFHKMERLNPKDAFQIQLVAEMFHHLNELAIYRGLRNSSIETEVPAPIWLPIMLGAFITLFCSMLLDIEHTRMHITLNTILGIFIGMFLFIIVLLDHPYTGSLQIKPKSYQKIFLIEQQLNQSTNFIKK
ncbi:MAG: DUF4239 domain-containing protein [Bacteroidia bacterium]|nr:DUF4239 domain-containing protein [Bacteroidia bacterium]